MVACSCSRQERHRTAIAQLAVAVRVPFDFVALVWDMEEVGLLLSLRLELLSRLWVVQREAGSAGKDIARASWNQGSAATSLSS